MNDSFAAVDVHWETTGDFSQCFQQQRLSRFEAPGAEDCDVIVMIAVLVATIVVMVRPVIELCRIEMSGGEQDSLSHNNALIK